jgi:hypothetical protein
MTKSPSTRRTKPLAQVDPPNPSAYIEVSKGALWKVQLGTLHHVLVIAMNASQAEAKARAGTVAGSDVPLVALAKVGEVIL